MYFDIFHSGFSGPSLTLNSPMESQDPHGQPASLVAPPWLVQSLIILLKSSPMYATNYHFTVPCNLLYLSGLRIGAKKILKIESYVNRRIRTCNVLQERDRAK